MDLERLSARDGTWQQLKSDWQDQCAAFGGDFADFAPGTMSELESLAQGNNASAGAFGSRRADGSFGAACQVNCTYLPGYDGKVVRVRFITLSPSFDFGEFGAEEYAEVLGGVFVGVMRLSESVWPAPHVKFHLRSPADRPFFDGVRVGLQSISALQTVELKGMWLYITKGMAPSSGS
jgi:hypothetical protein